MVQSVRFSQYLPVGRPEIAVQALNAWGIDEIVLLDIDATREGRGPDLPMVARASRSGLVPLTVGGGISSVEQIRDLIHAGADKVSINSSALKDPEFVTHAAEVFGSQCVVVSIDARRTGSASWEVFSGGGRTPAGLDVRDWAQRVESLGAGEIFLTSIDRDGTYLGYDVDLIEQVASSVGIPLIVCGGAGRPDHMLQAHRLQGVSAVAVGNMLHFTEHSVITAKAYLRAVGTDVRIDTYPTYGEAKFAGNGRLKKIPDEVQDELLFEFIPKEVI